MAHFAKVIDGMVVDVVVADQEFIDTGLIGDPSTFVQTSYNTRENVHYGPDGNPDDGIALRGNYAGVGYIYDNENDVFYPPQPFNSWKLNTEIWKWEPPTSRPYTGSYYWDENKKTWSSND